MSLGAGPSRGCNDLRLVQKAEVDGRGFGSGHRRHAARHELPSRLQQDRGQQARRKTFSAPKVPTEKRGITFAKFLGLAWTAANAKAKEIGWVA